VGVAIICFLSLAEAALLSVTSTTAERALAEKRWGALALQRLLGAEVDYLSTVMVSINLTLLATSLVVTHYVLTLRLEKHLAAVSLLVVIGILIFAEITPKTIGLHRAAQVAPYVAPPVAWLTRMLSWLVRLLTGIANGFCRCLHIRAVHRRHFVTEDDIKFFALLSGQEGPLEEAESEMIEGIMELPETTAGEIKRPRTDIVALDLGSSLSEAARIVAESGHSRIPVYRENLDDPVGVLHAKDLLLALRQKPAPRSLEVLLRPVMLVPESKPVDDLLREMRQKRASLGVVLDEYGGVDGLVTIEDILEQIVGPVRDEHDVREPEEILFLSPTMAQVDPRVQVDRIEDELGLQLPEGDYNTLAGFLLDRLAHMPEPGEKVTYGRFTFVIEAVEAQRITRVKVFWRPRAGVHGQEQGQGQPEDQSPEGR
jgi:CBS domain containing-hemolysin-like protein